MPKIKNITVEIAGEYKKLTVYFNTKNKYFYIKDCPEDILQITEFSNWALSYDELKNGFMTALREYHEQIKTMRKVIKVHYNVGHEVIRGHQDENDWQFRMPDKNHPLNQFENDNVHGNVYGFGFAIDYTVMFEITKGENVAYYRIIKDSDGLECPGSYIRSRNKENKDIVLDYSPERVKYLQNIKSELYNLMLRLGDFFSQPLPILEQIIDSKKALPFGNTNESSS